MGTPRPSPLAPEGCVQRDAELAAARLFAGAYDELRALSARCMRGERASPTLQPTAVVHEAYLRLAGRRDLDAGDRRRFVEAAASAIRRVLVDHARRRKARKRGDGARRVTLDERAPAPRRAPVDILLLDEALDDLASRNRRLRRVVELRFFGGLSTGEVARVLGVSVRTVEADWTVAKRWFKERLGGTGERGLGDARRPLRRPGDQENARPSRSVGR